MHALLTENVAKPSDSDVDIIYVFAQPLNRLFVALIEIHFEAARRLLEPRRHIDFEKRAGPRVIGHGAIDPDDSAYDSHSLMRRLAAPRPRERGENAIGHWYTKKSPELHGFQRRPRHRPVADRTQPAAIGRRTAARACGTTGQRRTLAPSEG
ncbi:MAG: hypothetical protein KGL11_08690 [Alphaproteobacteria bacterium]|nr:hypothetical protein [Alphaproteobacteria bacterium]